jgi:hypothetical protein
MLLIEKARPQCTSAAQHSCVWSTVVVEETTSLLQRAPQQHEGALPLGSRGRREAGVSSVSFRRRTPKSLVWTTPAPRRLKRSRDVILIARSFRRAPHRRLVWRCPLDKEPLRLWPTRGLSLAYPTPAPLCRSSVDLVRVRVVVLLIIAVYGHLLAVCGRVLDVCGRHAVCGRDAFCGRLVNVDVCRRRCAICGPLSLFISSGIGAQVIACDGSRAAAFCSPLSVSGGWCKCRIRSLRRRKRRPPAR